MYSLDLNQVTGLKDWSLDTGPIAIFELQQNYPNPFNNATIISYRVGAIRLAAGQDHVSPLQVDLEVYNILGQKVVTLVSENQAARVHTYDWDASNLPGGIYIYRLTIGPYSISKKAVILK